MKLQFPERTVNKSREFEDEDFSLGDVRVIMDILSSKLYARPIRAIVQEVGSNARDANREAGREDTPIEIQLPNTWDDNFIIRDNGLGISPERMSNVFLKYGESTKRTDNIQTGGFGIGAKTPFTYTDVFNIVTTTDDEDGVRRRRTYIAHKADGGLAKISRVTTEDVDTSEVQTGTAIGFAVAKEDFFEFKYTTQTTFRFWDPLPKVTGDKVEFAIEEAHHSGDNWWISNGSRGVVVLVDKIPYDVRNDTLLQPNQRYGKISRALSELAIRLDFNTGEIDVSATREDLDYTARTKQILIDAIEDCLDNLQQTVNDQVNQAPSLLEATFSWRNQQNAYANLVNTPLWNGTKLFPHILDTHMRNWNGDFDDFFKEAGLIDAKGNPMHHAVASDYFKVANYILAGTNQVETKKRNYRKAVDREVRIAKNITYVYNDTGRATPHKMRLLTILNQNPGHTLCVVTPKDEKATKAWLKHWGWWDHLPYVKLSTIAKTKLPKGARGSYTIKAIKRLKQPTYGYGRVAKWQADESLDISDGEDNIFVILKDGKPRLNGKFVSRDFILSAEKKLGEPIYGILYKYRNKVGLNWRSLKNALKEYIEEQLENEEVKLYIENGTKRATEVFSHLDLDKLDIENSELKEFAENLEISYNGMHRFNDLRMFAQTIEFELPETGRYYPCLAKQILEYFPILSELYAMDRTWHDKRNAVKRGISEIVNWKFPANLKLDDLKDENDDDSDADE